MNSDSWGHRFAERMKLALRGEPSVNAFAKRCGIAESLIRKYLAGGTPGLDKAAIVADAAGVSLDWLATGRQPMRPEAGQAPVLQSEPLERAIRITELWLERNRRTMQPPRKAAVILVLYEIIVQDLQAGRPPLDDERASTVLKLVA